MPDRFPRRRLAVLAVAAGCILLPAAAHARPAAGTRDGRGALSLPRQVTVVIDSLWQGLTSWWGKSGMTIDPNGQPAPPAPNNSGVTPGDSGGSIDPDGLTGDSGGSIDPNG